MKILPLNKFFSEYAENNNFDFGILKELPKIDNSGQLTLIGARRGMGTTTFMLQSAISICLSKQKTVYYFSPFLSAEKVAEKVLNLCGTIPENAPFFICDHPKISLESIENTINPQIKNGMIFIDNISRIQVPNRRRLFSKLKAIANKNDISFMVSLPYNRSKITKRTIIESKFSEYSDNIWFFTRKPYFDRFGIVNRDYDITTISMTADAENTIRRVKIRWNGKCYTDEALPSIRTNRNIP